MKFLAVDFQKLKPNEKDLYRLVVTNITDFGLSYSYRGLPGHDYFNPEHFFNLMLSLSRLRDFCPEFSQKAIISVGSGVAFVEKCFELMGASVRCYDHKITSKNRSSINLFDT